MIRQRLAIKLTPIEPVSWTVVLEQAKQAKLDLLPGIMSTPERQTYLSFTRPYLDFPIVILAHVGGPQPKKPGAGGKKWDKNPGTRTANGAVIAINRAHHGCRPPVEPPTLAALRTLVRHPQLAEKVEDAGHFAAEDHTNTQLLVALLEAVQKNPKLRLNSVDRAVARYRAGTIIKATAEKEWLIPAITLNNSFSTP